MSATWSESGEGERRWFLGTLATIRVAGPAAGDRFALIAGDDRFTLDEGGAAVVPMGVAHTFRVDSDTARVLVLSTPAGLERMIRAGSVPATAATLPPADVPRPSPDELVAIFEAHGQVNVGPGD